MPALCKRRGILRWRGIVKKEGKDWKTKWFGQGKKGGKEYKKALMWEEQKKKELAELESLKKIEGEDPAQGQNQIRTESLTIREWINSYLDDVKRRNAIKTYNEKTTTFRIFIKYLDDPDLPINDNINRQLAQQYLQDQFDLRSGNASNKDRKVLLTAWNWGIDHYENFPQYNPFATKKYPENRKERYVPKEDDWWKVYYLTAPKSQNRVMLTAFLHLAARKGEIFALKWQHIDWMNGQVQLFTKKTRDGSWESAWLPMTNELKHMLMWWWENRVNKDSENVFTITGSACETISGKQGFSNRYVGQPFKSRQHFLKKWCAKAGVKTFDHHAIRHLSATILYHAGYSVAVIQQILRHKSASTTEIYLKRLGLDPMKLKEAVSVFEDRDKPKKGKLLDLEKEKAPEKSISEAQN